LTWTITPKFPIQLKTYILVFRNGQLLNNDQYNLTDTNKITIVSTSFKIGANYTVATVSGIGSIGTGVFPNPVYPDAGIALSTGSTWASSIPNNSSNWNTAFSDRLKWDGGSTGLTASTGRSSLGGTTIGQSMFTLTNPSAVTFPRFNDNNSVSSLTASEFRTAIGAGVGTVTSVTVGSGTPLSINNNTTVPEISMAAASGSVNGYLSSTDWTTFNNKQAALGFTPANSTITIATTAPLQGGGNLTANRTLSITQASGSLNGFLSSTDWTTFNNKQPQLNGTGFVKASGTNITYDNSSYLRTGLADSTYLKLTGGTLTGALNGTTAGFNTKLNIGGIDGSTGSPILTAGLSGTPTEIHYYQGTGYEGSSVTLRLTNNNGSFYQNGLFFKSIMERGLDEYNGRIGIMGSDYLTFTKNSRIGLFNSTPNYTFDITGTLGVTGAATLSSTLAVTGNITEGGNNVMTNLDTVSLSNRINGKVGLTGNESISGTKTFNNLVNLSSNLILSGSYSSTNKILGKNSSDGIGNITVGNGLKLLSDTLTVNERFYFDLGTVAGQADNVTGTYNFSYSGNAFIVPSSLNGYCIDTVNIRAISCTNCPPVAGEKDYYMGVYKVSAGNRVTSSGATMQGSQIVCNEYDLKEENVNHVLTTGDVWWVYLNGSYFSDMEIIKASFIVKKTCN
jgi:hypothetical protein